MPFFIVRLNYNIELLRTVANGCESSRTAIWRSFVEVFEVF
jgi:hypothetical protein